MTLLSTVKRNLGILDPRERKMAFGLFFVILLTAALEVVGVGSIYPFLQLITDESTAQTNPFVAWISDATGVTDREHLLLLVGSIVFAIIIFTNAFALLDIFLRVRFTWNLNHTISSRLLTRYLEQPYEYFLNANSADLSRKVLQDSHKITAGTIDPMLNLLSRGTVALAILGFLVYLDPTATAVVLVTLGGLYGAIYLKIRHKLKSAGRKAVEVNKDRFKVVGEGLQGIKDVKVGGLEDVFQGRFWQPSRRYARLHVLSSMMKRIPNILIQTLAFGGVTALLIVFIFMGRPLETIVPLLGVVAFAGYRLLPAFEQIMTTLVAFRFHDHLVADIDHDLSTLGGEAPARAEPVVFENSIQLDAVTYQYPGAAQPALRGVTLDIPHRSTVAFVGRTGAGKTTLIDILLGLLAPHHGNVVVDGVALDHAALRRWRQQVGYVPQTIFLTDDTIRRNIAFGVPEDEIDEESVVRAARMAQIHDFISEQLPGGYETEVGERGVRLSGGQRQRLGIARALYHDPEVLVMDEATSQVDHQTESAITTTIEDLAGRKTLIIIAHRISTVRNADIIHVMENGEVVARGSYDHLSENEPLFQRLLDEPSIVVSPAT